MKGYMKTKYPINHFVDNTEDKSTITVKIADGIRKTVEDFTGRFGNLDEAKASHKSKPDKWSRKEILGHLIDSAANNHQRFVRAQYLKAVDLPNYEQVDWVNMQKYDQRTWKELLLFWKSYNLHLAHIIYRMPVECLQVPCVLGSNEPTTIGCIMADYLGHIQHHLRQIEEI